MYRFVLLSEGKSLGPALPCFEAFGNALFPFPYYIGFWLIFFFFKQLLVQLKLFVSVVFFAWY